MRIEPLVPEPPSEVGHYGTVVLIVGRVQWRINLVKGASEGSEHLLIRVSLSNLSVDFDRNTDVDMGHEPGGEGHAINQGILLQNVEAVIERAPSELFGANRADGTSTLGLFPCAPEWLLMCFNIQDVVFPQVQLLQDVRLNA